MKVKQREDAKETPQQERATRTLVRMAVHAKKSEQLRYMIALYCLGTQQTGHDPVRTTLLNDSLRIVAACSITPLQQQIEIFQRNSPPANAGTQLVKPSLLLRGLIAS